MAHERVKLAVIGCGTMGRIHLQGAILSGSAQIVAVADQVSDLAQQAAKRFEVPTVYKAGESAIDDPRVQAVVLAVPTVGRAKLALRALRAGKHVLIEKPSGLSADEIAELIGAAGACVGASCSSRYRFTPVADVAERAIREGALGEIRLIRAAILDGAGPVPENPRPAWRLSRALNGGGILANWGSYDLDFLLGILAWRSRPSSAFGATWGVPENMRKHAAPNSDAEALAAGLVRFEDGSALQLTRGEFLPMRTEAAWQVIGTRGALRLQMVAEAGGEVLLDTYADSQRIDTQVLWRGQTPEMDHHYGPIADFLRAIQTGQAPKTDLRRAFVVQSVIDSIYRSAASGTSVLIPAPPAGIS